MRLELFSEADLNLMSSSVSKLKWCVLLILLSSVVTATPAERGLLSFSKSLDLTLMTLLLASELFELNWCLLGTLLTKVTL